jgi:hypothetical protein
MGNSITFGNISNNSKLDTVTKIKPLYVNGKKVRIYKNNEYFNYQSLVNTLENAANNKNRQSVNFIIDNFHKSLFRGSYCMHTFSSLMTIVSNGYEEESIKLLLNTIDYFNIDVCKSHHYSGGSNFDLFPSYCKLLNDIKTYKFTKLAKIILGKLDVSHRSYMDFLYIIADKNLYENTVNVLIELKFDFKIEFYNKLCELYQDLAIKYLRAQEDSDTILLYACLHKSQDVISYIKESIPITKKMIKYNPDGNQTSITVCVVNKMIDEVKYLVPIYYKDIHDELIVVLNENPNLYTDLMSYLAINSFHSIYDGKQFYRQIFTNTEYATKITDLMILKDKFDNTIYDILCELHQDLAIKYIPINKDNDILLWHACAHKSTIVINHIEHNIDITNKMIEYNTNCIHVSAQNGLISEFRMMVKKYYGVQNELIKRFSSCGKLLLHIASHNNAPCMRVLLTEWKVQQVFLKELHKEYGMQISDVVEPYIINDTNSTTCDTTNAIISSSECSASRAEGQI